MAIIVAVVFVFVWSTGFVVGKYILPHADPTLFLLVRTTVASLMFSGIAVAMRLPWPRWRDVPKHLFAGVLLQGMYLSGTYWAIDGGVPPAVMALLGALQPLLTAVFAIPILKEYPRPKVWLGLVLGMCGVAMVIEPGLSGSAGAGFGTGALLIGLMAILSITFGTIVQKTSISAADIRVSSALQNMGTVGFTGIFVVILGEHHWDGSIQLWGALFWASFILSGIGAFLLVWIVRRGQAATASSLMFLAPPLAAIQAYYLFGDHLQALQLAGFVIALLGVLICNWRLPVRRKAR